MNHDLSAVTLRLVETKGWTKRRAMKAEADYAECLRRRMEMSGDAEEFYYEHRQVVHNFEKDSDF